MEANDSRWPSDLIIWTLIGMGVKQLTMQKDEKGKKKEDKREERERAREIESKLVVSLPHTPSMRILISSLGQTGAPRGISQHFFREEMLIHRHPNPPPSFGQSVKKHNSPGEVELELLLQRLTQVLRGDGLLLWFGIFKTEQEKWATITLGWLQLLSIKAC